MWKIDPKTADLRALRQVDSVDFTSAMSLRGLSSDQRDLECSLQEAFNLAAWKRGPGDAESWLVKLCTAITSACLEPHWSWVFNI